MSTVLCAADGINPDRVRRLPGRWCLTCLSAVAGTVLLASSPAWAQTSGNPDGSGTITSPSTAGPGGIEICFPGGRSSGTGEVSTTPGGPTFTPPVIEPPSPEPPGPELPSPQPPSPEPPGPEFPSPEPPGPELPSQEPPSPELPSPEPPSTVPGSIDPGNPVVIGIPLPPDVEVGGTGAIPPAPGNP